MAEEPKKKKGNPPGVNRRTSAAERAKRKLDVASLLETGLSKAEIQRLLDIDDTTLWRVFKELEAKVLTPETVELYQGWKAKQRQELETLKDVVLASPDFNDRDRVAALLQINDRLVALLGLDSERLMPPGGGQEALSVTVQYVGPEHEGECFSPRMLPDDRLPKRLPPASEERPEPTLEELMTEFRKGTEGEQP